MVDEHTILRHILKVSQELTQIKDVDMLLEKILTEARQLVNADAGSIYVRSGELLHFSVTQNDTLQKQLPVGRKLIYSRFTVPVNNETISGYVANTGKCVNIEDAYELSGELPFSFNRKYDELSHYRTRSILSLPLTTPRNKIIGVLQLINAKDEEGHVIPFSPSFEPFIFHFANTVAVALERTQMTRAIIMRMLRMSEMRDPKETGAHVNRVGAISAELYEAWAGRQGVACSEIEKHKDVLRLASMLHDVGKVAISDMILKKPARLSVEEFEIMKHHTYLGARLFADARSEFDEAAFVIALEHHEKWDGSGYPGEVRFEKDSQSGEVIVHVKPDSSKAGEDIHPYARVVALADVFDALLSKRAYKPAWKEEEVLENIKSESGKHFDPTVVEVFIDNYDVIRNVRNQYPE